MPNGRTALFRVTAAMLINALRDMHDKTQIGEGFTPAHRLVTALSLRAALRGLAPTDPVAIEEQHFDEYIIHIGGVDEWPCIDSHICAAAHQCSADSIVLSPP